MHIKELIQEQVDPDALVEILGLSTEQLMYYLDDCINEAIDNGTFSYLQQETSED